MADVGFKQAMQQKWLALEKGEVPKVVRKVSIPAGPTPLWLGFDKIAWQGRLNGEWVTIRVYVRAGLAGLRQWIFWSRQWMFWTYHVTCNVLMLRYVLTPKPPQTKPTKPRKIPQNPQNTPYIFPLRGFWGFLQRRAHRLASGSVPYATGFFAEQKPWSPYHTPYFGPKTYNSHAQSRTARI